MRRSMSIFLVVVLIVILLALVLLFVFALYGLIGCFSFAPFVATHGKIADQMVRMAKIEPGTRVIELGSGDGVISLCAAQRGAIVIGVELNPILVMYARLRTWRRGLQTQATFVRTSAWDFDIPSNTQVVMVYGLPKFMAKVWKKMENECRPGTLLVSHAFMIPGKKPDVREGAVLIYRV